MTSAITIFLLIGVARWAAHIFECDACQVMVRGNAFFLLEAMTYVFGWPVRVAAYLGTTLGIKEPGPSSEEVDARIKDAVQQALKGVVGGEVQMIEVKQMPGETNEQVQERLGKIMQAEYAKFQAEREKEKTNG